MEVMGNWISYDDVAETYERVHAPHMALPARDLVVMANPPAGGRLLDVGTGTGVGAAAAHEAVGPNGLAVGIDMSMGMLIAGHRARPGVALAAGVAVDLPFRDGTFDSVTANFVMSHFRSYKTALADMTRVMRPGARLAVSAWADARDDLQSSWNELVQNVVPREMLEPVWKQASPWHDLFRDRRKLEEALRDAGLRHLRSEQHEYRFTYSVEDFVAGLESWATGRFVREMLGESSWESFKERVRATFAERFADPLNDFRTVVMAVGTKT